MKILVTGASGFIGSRVAEVVAARWPEATVVGVGRSARPPRPSKLANYEYVSCDLSEAGIEQKLPSRINVVMHLAGDRRTFIPPQEYTRQTMANVVNTSRMADYAAQAGAELFLFASSVYAYSGQTTAPFQEDKLCLPAENLGATKVAAESLLRARAIAGQFKALAFRIFTVYGPGSSAGQFIPQAIAKLGSAEPVAKFGAPDVQRDFVYLDDVAEAFAAGLAFRQRDIQFEAVNIGSGQGTSIREVVQLLAGLMGSRKQITFDPGPQSKADTNHQADIAHAQSLLGWKPAVLLEAGLRRTLEALATTR